MEQESARKLDADFDQHLASMKKYILDLKDRKSKQLCALWIKKLCEENNHSLCDKIIRNEYSSRLLGLLENYESLKFPFSERPQSDSLKPYDEAMELHFSQEKSANKKETKEFEVVSDDCYQILYQNPDQIIDNQFKMLEARYKEEKLHLQQFHTEELQKVLDRKNNEIETLKTNFNRKKKEYEENIINLEKKVKNVSNQMVYEKEAFEKELNQIKVQSDKTLEKKQFEFEKKISELVNRFEKERLDTQKEHTKAFQDLVDETNVRLKRVEADYNHQQMLNDQVIKELENRTHLLKAEIEKNIKLAQSLDYDNNQKQAIIESLEKRLNEEINKNSSLQNEIIILKEERIRETGDLRSQYELMLESKIRDSQTQTDSLKDELKFTKNEYEKRIEKLSSMLREKENALSNANLTIKQQKIQTEQALNDLKAEVERNSNKLYDEMKSQMTKVENDLGKSKAVREKQAKEFNKQIESLKSEHTKEIERLNSEFKSEKQRIHQTHELMFTQLQSQYHQQMIDNNHASKLRIDDLGMKISRLEQELIDSNELRKQQITELGLLRQEEKIKNEHEIEKIRSKYDQDVNGVKKRLKEEIEAAREEIRARDERIRRLNERVNELEEGLISTRNDNKRLKEVLEREKNECYSLIEAEKNTIKRSCSHQLKEFEKELEAEKSKCKSIEKKIKQLTYDNEQTVLSLKMQYEEKLKGMLPLSIKNDYEETISALRSQVDSLQQRAMILQSEVEERNQVINSSYTPSI